MRRKILCCSLAVVLVAIISLQLNIVKSDERIVETVAKAEISVQEEEAWKFDEDKYITEKTYLISEKEIDVPVLLYHEFYETEPQKEFWGSVSTPEKFEEDMKYIIGKGYKFVSLDRVIDYKKGLKGLPEKSVVLTFDDGYTSNYTLIYPILKKYCIPATIFVVGDMMEADHHFDWDIAKKMNDEGLVTIYTHGHSHVDMTKLDINEFREKTANNLKTVKEKLGEQRHVVYSYPYGIYNEETNNVLKELGVEMCMTTKEGLNKKENLESGMINRNYVAYNFPNYKLSTILKGK